MLRIRSLTLVFTLAFGASPALAKSDSASYYGGTMAEFKDAKKEVKGRLLTSDEKALVFKYGKDQTASIPYNRFVDMEYGQKFGRRGDASGNLVADKVRFTDADLRAARTLEANIVPVEGRVGTAENRLGEAEQNAQRMSGKLDELAAVSKVAVLQE